MSASSKKHLLLVTRLDEQGGRNPYTFYIKPQLINSVEPTSLLLGRGKVDASIVVTARERFFVIEPATRLTARINGRIPVDGLPICAVCGDEESAHRHYPDGGHRYTPATKHCTECRRPMSDLECGDVTDEELVCNECAGLATCPECHEVYIATKGCDHSLAQ